MSRPLDHQKISFGGAKRTSGPKSRAGVKPRHAASYTDILAAIATAYLTTAEARTIGLRALQRVRDTQAPMDKGDPRFYRAETDSEAADLEEPVCRSTATPVE